MRRLVAGLLAGSFLLAAPVAGADAPKTLPYDEYQPIPAGYRKVDRPRIGMIITGAGLLATGAVFMGYGFAERAAENERYERLRAQPEEGAPSGAGFQASTIHFVAAGIFAAVGTPLLIVGLTTKNTVLVRDESPTLSLAPVVAPTFGGLSLGGSF